MGAPTSNRKRGGYIFSLRYLSSPSPSLDSDSPVDLQVSKKPRLSPMHLNPKPPISPFSLQSTFSRVQQYPKPTKPISREVHGPCRPTPKFSHPMGNAMFRNLEDAKNNAFETFRYVRKDKEVIDLDEGCSKDVIIDGLSDEEVEILDGGESVGLTQKSCVDVFLKEKYQYFADNQIQGSSSVVSDLSNDGGNKSGFLSVNRLQGSSSVVSDLSNQTPKTYDAGKMFSYLSLNREVEEVHEPPHKQLYEASQSRNSKLSHLSYLIELTSKKLPKIPFFRRSARKPEKDLLREPFVDLTNEEEAEVSRALSNSNRRKLLVAHSDSNIEITGEVLQCLRPGAWLNDEVINLYLELLREREKREPEKFLKCHFFNTFFYKKLISGKGGYDFKAVKRWTTKRKIGYGLIECDKIFIPIHKEIHWCLAIINKKDQKFQYLDSLKGRDSKVLQILARYYADEVKDKSEKDIDVNSWKQEYVNDLPAQENGFDCGMFMIKYADFYSRGLGLCFNQDNMPYFRKRTAKEILKLKAE